MDFSPALSVSEFRDRFPEFADATDGLIQKNLEIVANAVDPSVYGDSAHDAAYYLAADHVALSPFGGGARLASANGTTTYKVLFEELKRACCFGPLLVR